MGDPAKRAITLDDLVALNDEIRALVRAGVPLEKGLLSVGADLPGRLGELAVSLGARLERGESLVDVLDDRGDGFPRAYRAVVVAGIQSGHLPAALEGISTAARRASELRRVMIVSMIYPTMVLLVATGLFQFTASRLTPVFAMFYEELVKGDMPQWYATLISLVEIAPSLLMWFWLIFVAASVFWILRSGRASALNASRIHGIPTVARVLRAGRMASFTDVLAMMIEQQVPLDEALVLSAEASGDRGLIQSCNELAERVRSGNQAISLPAGLPPLLGWLIVGGVRQDQLAKSLRQTAKSYRRRAMTMGNWLTIYLPIILSAGVGGLIVAFYAFVVIAPFYDLIYKLSAP